MNTFVMTGRRRRRPALPSGRRVRRGGSLVELIIAMLLLSVGLFSIIGTSGSVSEQLGGGMRQTVAAGIAQARIDSLTSIGCQSLTPGGATSTGRATTRGVEETWSVQDARNIKRINVTLRVPGRRVPILYETIIPCRD